MDMLNESLFLKDTLPPLFSSAQYSFLAWKRTEPDFWRHTLITAADSCINIRLVGKYLTACYSLNVALIMLNKQS